MIRIAFAFLSSVGCLAAGGLVPGASPTRVLLQVPIATPTPPPMPMQVPTAVMSPPPMPPSVSPALLAVYATYALAAYYSFAPITPPPMPAPTPTPVLPTPAPTTTPTPMSAVPALQQVAEPVRGQVVGQASFASGLSVTVFERPTSTGRVEYVVAFRGTEPTDLRDWSTDLQQPLWVPEQYTEAISYAKTWVDKADTNNATVVFIGHSLGGALAEYAGLAFSRDAVCMNAPALGLNTIMSLGGKEIANASHIHHLVRFGDDAFFLTQLMPGSAHFGSVQLLDSSPDMRGRGLDTVLDLHDMNLIRTSLLKNEHITEPVTVRESLSRLESAWQNQMKELVTGAVKVIADRITEAIEKEAIKDEKGVRIHFDERILAEVLRRGTGDESAKLIDEFTRRLVAAQSEPERAQAVASFVGEVKRRFLEVRGVCPLHDLVTVSLKSLVARAERYKGDWSGLPDDLRRPGPITRIRGFAITGDDILLIGSKEPGAPVLEIDDLIVGVQSVWKENAIPVVSLDPDPANIDGDPSVRIQGVAEDSAFALSMLEADYAMKKIMAGADRVQVPGYRTLTDTLSQADRTFISRFWLYPVQPRVGDILVSPDNSSAVFSGAVQVLSEEMLNLKEGLVGTGEAFLPAEEAADSFTAHFDEIARQRPVFQRLQSLFDVVLVARIWHVRGLESPLLDRLRALPHRAVPIPRTYRAIRVLLRRDERREYYIQGGVQAKVGAGRRTWLDLDDHGFGALRQYGQRISESGEVSTPLPELALNAVAPSTRPDSSSRDFTAAVTNLFRGDLKAALAAADRLVAHDDLDAEALVLRALIQMRRADYAQARADAQKAREIDPGDRETAAAAGEILFQCAWMQGDPEAALREMDNSLRDDLQRASGQVARGEALLLLDRPEEAKQAFLKAVELDPASALAYARLSQLELAQGRTLAAKPWVQKAQALDSNLAAVRIASAQWELVTVRPDLAEKIASEVWENQATDPTARLQALAILAAVSASREKWKNVDAYVALMGELSAASPEVLVAAAEIAILWGERERASTYLDKAVRLAPSHPLVLKMRARLAR
ncbi:MAG: DUF2974 domain-containing protein [Acidobacteriia bacterium]|nr:DUF2974 domain-containing protein [Terriglobia bacterium]